MKQIFKGANILIPSEKTDKTKWSVVACDQYTSDKKYWNEVEEMVGDFPSTLRITLPEIFLEEGNVEERIENINKTMNDYINNDIFTTLENSYVYTERTLKNGMIRRGIIGVLDLEEYDFNKGSVSAIRATEGTVLDRLPPRIKIRENAPLELPHVMILIDDDNCSVIEPVAEKANDELEKVYDFKLMQNSGYIKGYKLPEQSQIAEEMQKALTRLADKNVFEKKYNLKDTDILHFAVGDGNHSLATAKSCWDMKKLNFDSTHPARYALIELVNLHDTSLQFEAIHRVVFDINPDDVIKKLKEYYPQIEISDIPIDIPEGFHHFTIVTTKGNLYAILKDPICNLSVGSLQNFIDDYIKSVGGKVDYIHGDDAVKENVSETSIGFLLSTMTKNQLFETVIKDGALPRKTFSMGHAEDKRFYLEAKTIV